MSPCIARSGLDGTLCIMYMSQVAQGTLLRLGHTDEAQLTGGCARWRHWSRCVQSTTKSARLDGQAEHRAYAVHRLVLPAYSSASVSGVVPPARCGSVQTSTCSMGDCNIFIMHYIHQLQHMRAHAHAQSYPAHPKNSINMLKNVSTLPRQPGQWSKLVVSLSPKKQTDQACNRVTSHFTHTDFSFVYKAPTHYTPGPQPWNTRCA